MNKIKTYLVVLLIFCIGISNSQAQYYVKKNELAKDILKDKTIYYEIKELSKEQLETYKDQRTIDNFKNQYHEENSILESTLKKHWTISKEVVGIRSEELNTRLENNQETWYISLNKNTNKFFEKRIHKHNIYFYFQHYILTLYKDNQQVISVPLVNDFISELDMHFAVILIQNIANDYEKRHNLKEYEKAINLNSSLLKMKTLLIPKNYTQYTEEYVKQFYKWDVKIVEEQEILDIIHNNDPNYAYLVININYLSEEPSFNHFIFDGGTNNPIFLYRNSSSYTKTGIQRGKLPTLQREIQFLFPSHFRKYN